MYFSEKHTAGILYTKEGENICPPSKKYLYEISFNFTWQNVFEIKVFVINMYEYSVKTIF